MNGSLICHQANQSTAMPCAIPPSQFAIVIIMKSTEVLAEHIKAKAANCDRYVIAISGFGGAGKSTISHKLVALLGNATLIHTDDFIDSDENGALEGYHLNWDELESQVLKVAKTAGTLTKRIYDWGSNKPVFEETHAKKYVIIEGSIWLMQNAYRPYFDTTVWVNVPQDIANARGKKRDAEEYGVQYDELWDMVWGPRERDSFIRLKPNENADISLDNSYD